MPLSRRSAQQLGALAGAGVVCGGRARGAGASPAIREISAHLESLRRDDGGYGHVMNTLWALQAPPLLGFEPEQRGELVAWLRACQRPGALSAEARCGKGATRHASSLSSSAGGGSG